MALLKNLKISIEGLDDLTIPDTYAVVVDAAYSKITRSAKYGIVFFKDEATRRSYGKALDVLVEKLAVFRQKETANRALQPAESDTQADIRAKEEQAEVPRLELAAAGRDLALAQRALNLIRMLPQSGTQPEIGPERSEQVLTDGHIDLVKLYTYIKALPDWADARDT